MARPTNLRLLAVVGALSLAAFVLALTATHKPARATLPGANGKIAFVGDNEGYMSGIYTMNPDGSGLETLVPPGGLRGGMYNESPSWSPDGQRMAFTKSHNVDEYTNIYDGIYVMNADGSGEEGIMPDGYDPQWLPNGRKISFLRRAEGASETGLYVMKPDGSGVEKRASFPISPYSHTWSPDGRKIAFGCSARPRRADWEICVMKSDGSDMKKLTRNRKDDEGPDWSPDGRKIVFSRYHKGCDSGYCDDIHVINTDGSGNRRLTDSPNMSELGPVWSPDGRRIAFGRYGSENPPVGIYVMKADGSKEHRVLDYDEFGLRFYSLAWQPL